MVSQLSCIGLMTTASGRRPPLWLMSAGKTPCRCEKARLLEMAEAWRTLAAKIQSDKPSKDTSAR
jgi:hypothetical protein